MLADSPDRYDEPIRHRSSARVIRTLRTFVMNQTPLLLLIVLIVTGSIVSNAFLSVSNLTNILWISSVLGIVSLGQCLLIIAAQFDMSVAYSVALSGIVALVAQKLGVGIVGSVAAALLTGIAVGLFNGCIVVLAKANPFLVTLCSQTLLFAIALALTESNTLYASAPGFEAIGRTNLFSTINVSGVAFIALAVILDIALKRTRFGRVLYAVGSSDRVARLSGIHARVVVLATFVLCGVMSAVAGVFLAARNGSTAANVSIGFDFQSIIVVVLGGTSLFGGRGGALRTVVGVLILGVLDNIMILIGLPVEIQDVVQGLVFLLVVLVDSKARRQRV